MHRKMQVWNSCLQLLSRPPKSGRLFGKFNVEQFLKSLLGRSNSLEPPVVGFSNSLPYGLEESRVLRALIS